MANPDKNNDEWVDEKPSSSVATDSQSSTPEDWTDVPSSDISTTNQTDQPSSEVKAEDKPSEDAPFTDFVKGVAQGLIKGGANLLESEQKLLDIVTLPSRTTFEEKPNATLREKILGQNIKRSVAPVTNVIYGDMASKANEFANDYLKTNTLIGKVASVLAQAPGLIAETEMMGGKIVGLAKLGILQGSEEGKIGARSAKQAAINASLGKVFGAISKINPGPQTSIALKSIATASRAALGGIVGSGASALSNGDLYANDPNKFDNFIVDFVASGLMTAMPSAKPYDLAKKVSSVIEAKTKVFDEFVGTMKDSVNADLNHAIAYGVDRPVEAMFTEVMRGQKPVKTYKELVKKTESSIQETQQEKASAIDKNSTAKIQMEPTLGLETLKNNELMSPGGTANKRVIKYYDTLIAEEKARVKDMTVLEAFKRQGQLKSTLNDQAMVAQNKPVLSKTEKVATQAIISDYNRALSDAVPEFKKLSAKESAKISLKDLLVSRSVIEQTSKKFGFDINEAARSAQLRGAGIKMSLMGSALQAAKDIILRGSPVERMTKEIMSLQKQIDAIAKLQAKKIINQEKIEIKVSELGRKQIGRKR